jgi:hypothetical protein
MIYSLMGIAFLAAADRVAISATFRLRSAGASSG